MATENPDFFQCPAYKLMLSDIKSAVVVKRLHDNEVMILDSPNFDPDDKWRVTLKYIETTNNCIQLPPGSNSDSNSEHGDATKDFQLVVQLIWVQGVVVRVETSKENGVSSLVITDDDGETEAWIHEYDALPGGNHPDIQEGIFFANFKSFQFILLAECFCDWSLELMYARHALFIIPPQSNHFFW